MAIPPNPFDTSGAQNQTQGQQQQTQQQTPGTYNGVSLDPRAFVDNRIQATQHRAANDQDYNYWLPKFDAAGGIGTGEYWYNRMTDPEGTGSNAGEGGRGTNQFNFTPWQQSPQESQLFDMLMGRAKQGLNINSKDPIIANQVNAYGAQQTRGMRDYLSGLAESGGPEANMSMEKRMASEQASQATGGMQAQLMQNELNARRQEIQNALTQMGGMLTADQQLALQKELAYLSNDQFLRSLGLQAQGQAFNQYALQSGLGG